MKAWLHLARLSNLPTVWTNVGAGMAIATMLSHERSYASHGWLIVLLMMLAASCLYVGGMVLNDVFDIAIDRAERPNRPLPSGTVSVSTARTVGFLLLAAGVGCAALGANDYRLPAVAAAIAVLSLLYNATHRATAWSVVPLALCRTLLYVLGVVAIVPTVEGRGFVALGLLGGAVLIHTIAFSLIARGEVSPSQRRCPDCSYNLTSATTICPECGALTTDDALAARSQWKQQTRMLLFGVGTFALAAPAALATLVLLLTLGSDINGGTWPLPGVAVAFVIITGWVFFTYRRLFATPPNVQGFVLGSIAAFCLYDAFLLLWLNSTRNGWIAALAAFALFFVVRFAHRRIPGT